jgi:surfactin synthase thioesterase subunit
MNAARHGRWLLRTPDDEAEGRLFALPYSGCGASMYRQWPRFYGGMELCPVQLPGRENRIREDLLTSYREMAEALVDALGPYFDRPFGFFGHCGSALAAYETAVLLAERAGPIPACIFISSQVAPQNGPYGTYLTMTDAELAEELRRLIRQMGGDPVPDLIDLCLDVMRADVRANANYQVPDPVPVPCPLTVIGWREDTNVRPSLMDGWEKCGPATYRLLDGDHFRFLQAPEEFLNLLAADLGLEQRLGGATGDGLADNG